MTLSAIIDALQAALRSALEPEVPGVAVGSAEDEMGAFDVLNGGRPGSLRVIVLAEDEAADRDAPRGLSAQLTIRVIVQTPRTLSADSAEDARDLLNQTERVRRAVLAIVWQQEGEPDFGSDTWQEMFPAGDERRGSPHPEATPLRFAGATPYRTPWPDAVLAHPAREMRFTMSVGLDLPVESFVRVNL